MTFAGRAPIFVDAHRRHFFEFQRSSPTVVRIGDDLNLGHAATAHTMRVSRNKRDALAFTVEKDRLFLRRAAIGMRRPDIAAEKIRGRALRLAANGDALRFRQRGMAQ